ncbi:uncharacterized protein LOC117174494 isoform X2 [Belonocnema kinseyi]|uniref:uncharacterized protein LOC117174494 isoform X2 n=1 Tax=Belonocnema kinseyi TaxID=2817044 RepID=UPI00143DA23C|nr:uncharacterized protein LOC117174494 isoform X2 [Belonocnema kinseyi]
MADGKMNSETKSDEPSLVKLQQEALACLDGFPNKVIELNNIIETYMPVTIKTRSSCRNTARRVPRSRAVSSTILDYDLTTNPELDVTSCYSLSAYDRGHTRRGICKRKFYRLIGFHASTLRRRPGPLGQLLAFIASKLTMCAKNFVITPSWYIIDRIIYIIFQRRQLKNVQCGPSADWNASISSYINNYKNDNTILGNFISVIRPAAVQLIADTTVLKRWIQALSLMSPSTEMSNELVHVTRNTETIDCWAYELFFHLKYLQVNRMQNIKKAISEDFKITDEVTHMNLWHRMIQLRDNYIILYESLFDDQNTESSKFPKINNGASI